MKSTSSRETFLYLDKGIHSHIEVRLEVLEHYLVADGGYPEEAFVMIMSEFPVFIATILKFQYEARGLVEHGSAFETVMRGVEWMCQESEGCKHGTSDIISRENLQSVTGELPSEFLCWFVCGGCVCSGFNITYPDLGLVRSRSPSPKLTILTVISCTAPSLGVTVTISHLHPFNSMDHVLLRMFDHLSGVGIWSRKVSDRTFRRICAPPEVQRL